MEVAEQVGVAKRTLRNWLATGRSKPDSEHGRFAVAVDRARDVAARADMTLGEFRGDLNRAVRAGSVAAMRVGLELYDREPEGEDDPFAQATREGGHTLTELDERRQGAELAGVARRVSAKRSSRTSPG